jgi:hypothetical protein
MPYDNKIIAVPAVENQQILDVLIDIARLRVMQPPNRAGADLLIQLNLH